MSKTPGDQVLRDPTKTYPKPPFEKQSQPWLGLARKMTPPPDHGEKTYRGRLIGRKALIKDTLPATVCLRESGQSRFQSLLFAPVPP
jgi:hypothetical protein